MAALRSIADTCLATRGTISFLRDVFGVFRSNSQARSVVEQLRLVQTTPFLRLAIVTVRPLGSLGAKGYLLQDCSDVELLRYIESVASGKHYTSPSMTTLLVTKTRRVERFARHTPGLDEPALQAVGHRLPERVLRGRTHRPPHAPRRDHSHRGRELSQARSGTHPEEAAGISVSRAPKPASTTCPDFYVSSRSATACVDIGLPSTR